MAEPPRYTAIDITGWSPAQLDALPFFKRLTINPPAGPGVPYDFSLVARTESGFCAGTVGQGIPYAGSRGVRLTPDAGGGYTADILEPFGTYSWGYWSCDPTDCHYSFGYVRDCTVSDVNYAGQMIGRATVAGSGEYASGATHHAYRYDTRDGMVDLFPADGPSTAACINNRGEIGGTVWGVGAYRRAPDGAMTFLDPVAGYGLVPRWMNAAGVMIGARYPSRAGVAWGGAATFDLPDLGGFETVTASDLNDGSWIVGNCGNFADPETYAMIWEPVGDGVWRAHDLVEQLDTPDVLLERALVIDASGNIIAAGHEDGTDFFASRLYWLMPDLPLDGWCTPEIGLHPESLTTTGPGAVFSVAIVNTDAVTSYQWRRDGAPIDSAANPSAATPTLVLAGLTTADSGAPFDCVVVSDCGTVTTDPATLTIVASCPADLTGDGLLDLGDVGAFISAFTSADLLADLTGDGVLDLADVNAFVASFTGGCP